MAGEIGVLATWEAVKSKVSVGHATGYSAAGLVVQVGEGVAEFRVGDRVACAGAQCAHHAEFIEIPRNLAVPIPSGVDWNAASAVALGAIALQGVRRASPTLGESFLVIGLGAIGQIVVQLLKANGCRVVASDLEDARVELALRNGCDVGFAALADEQIQRIASLTAGLGVDGVIVCASSGSSEIVHDAFSVCRKKGRVVLIGDVGLDLRREDFYAKEIDFLISSSYGPGRYDRLYEEKGLDYPVPFVRWTEGRNMAEYLEQVRRGNVRLDGMASSVKPLSEAGAAYQVLSSDSPERAVLSFLDFGEPQAGERAERAIHIGPARHHGSAKIRIGIVGAGGFAQAIHVPNLKRSSLFEIVAVANRRGHSARVAADTSGAEIASTSSEAVVRLPDVEAVLVSTRHDQHAKIVLGALSEGKHVLVEKPLCLRRGELEQIDSLVIAAGKESPVLLTGHNRRFSPHFMRLRSALRDRVGPLIVDARMNAGFLPPGHWVHGDEGGGRNIGEACHYYDLFVALCGLGATATVSWASPNAPYSRMDNFHVALKFPDGSLCNFTYSALGHADLGKERIECSWDGKSAVIDDWKSIRFFGAKAGDLKTPIQEKGHFEEIQAFGSCLKNGGPWPVPWEEQRDVSRIAFDVQDELNRG